MVEYSYDAWGNQQVSGSNTTLGNLNPFRYRSYFYDTETELYYLNTRYYDPIYCRFINMDSFDYADPEQLNGLNLYVYCANNPVMGYDPEGTTAWWEWLLLAVAVTAVVVAGVVATVATGGTALVAGGIAIGGSVAGVTDIVGQGLSKGWDNISVGEVAASIFIGGTVGGAGGAGMASGAYTAGAFALAGGGSSSAGTAIAGAGIFALNILFSKGSGRRIGHNKHENQMWDEAMRLLDIHDKELIQRLHQKNRKMPYAETLKELIKNLKEILSKLGL